MCLAKTRLSQTKQRSLLVLGKDVKDWIGMRGSFCCLEVSLLLQVDHCWREKSSECICKEILGAT